MLTEYCVSNHEATRELYRPNRTATKFFRRMNAPRATPSWCRPPIRTAAKSFLTCSAKSKAKAKALWRLTMAATTPKSATRSSTIGAAAPSLSSPRGASVCQNVQAPDALSQSSTQRRAIAKETTAALPAQHPRKHDAPRLAAWQLVFLPTFRHSFAETEARAATISSFAAIRKCLGRFGW